jgi:hypothetical protein
LDAQNASTRSTGVLDEKMKKRTTDYNGAFPHRGGLSKNRDVLASLRSDHDPLERLITVLDEVITMAGMCKEGHNGNTA